MFHMIKNRLLPFLFSFFLFLFPLTAAAEGETDSLPSPNLSAQAAILYAPDSSAALYEKSARERLPMASTTKIMTGLIALEYAEAHDNPVVKITEKMVAVEGSSMGLKAGYKLSVRDIVTGMMMSSGNDAANALALFIGKTSDGFAGLMNERAEQIGMTDTHFVTPSGLDDAEHYTTAYDMALLGTEALRNDSFSEIVSQASATVTFAEPEQKIRYQNHNKLLSLYDGCIGLKTGYTKKSGRCLVSAAERNGVTLIAVTLNAPDDWQDHSLLFDYGFSNIETAVFDETAFHTQVPVVGGQQEKLRASGSILECSVPKGSSGLLNKAVHLPRFVYAPVMPGEQIGSIDYYFGGKKIASVPIRADEPAACQTEEAWHEKIFGFLKTKKTA